MRLTKVKIIVSKELSECLEKIDDANMFKELSEILEYYKEICDEMAQKNYQRWVRTRSYEPEPRNKEEKELHT